MNLVKRRLRQLRQYENNPRSNSDAVPKVKESIKKYGYKVPMVIDRDNTLVAGHTRFCALAELEEERGYELEYDCVLADDLTDQEINEFRIVDNLVGEQAEWDITKLKEELNFLPNLDLNLFGEIPALTLEDIQLEEENKVDVSTDKIKFQAGPDKFEISEAEYHSWVEYVITTYNMGIVQFMKMKLEIDPADREYEKIEK